MSDGAAMTAKENLSMGPGEYATWRAYLALDRFVQALDERSRSSACRWALAWGRAARAARQPLAPTVEPRLSVLPPNALLFANPIQGSPRSSSHHK